MAASFVLFAPCISSNVSSCTKVIGMSHTAMLTYHGHTHVCMRFISFLWLTLPPSVSASSSNMSWSLCIRRHAFWAQGFLPFLESASRGNHLGQGTVSRTCMSRGMACFAAALSIDDFLSDDLVSCHGIYAASSAFFYVFTP
jgi:hypothetical protein